MSTTFHPAIISFNHSTNFQRKSIESQEEIGAVSVLQDAVVDSPTSSAYPKNSVVAKYLKGLNLPAEEKNGQKSQSAAQAVKASDLAGSSSSSRLSTSSSSSTETTNKRPRRASTSSSVVSGKKKGQEILPVHVIKRTFPLQVKGSNPAHCLDMIDQMYNIYYELEVRSALIMQPILRNT